MSSKSQRRARPSRPKPAARRSGALRANSRQSTPLSPIPPGTLVWLAPYLNISGYGEEARNFVHGLRRKGIGVVAHPLHPVSPGFYNTLAAGHPDMAHSLALSMKEPPRDLRIGVIHAPAEVARRVRGCTFSVSRTMYETDWLPDLWVTRLNQIDEVWVPTEFNVETFKAAGVHTPIYVVPGGVDVSVFRPDLPPLDIPGTHGTVFLSIFEWSYRKGPDVLLAAWARAFSPDDDVTLVLRCFPRFGFNSHDTTAEVNRLVDLELARLGKARRDVATISVLGTRLSPMDMPRLLNAADCYVSPARGEGWGRPLTEAMACGLAVIATDWGAPKAFMSPKNSLPLALEGLTVVDDRMDIPHYRGHKWAEPSTEHLVELLRFAVSNPRVAREIGERARLEMVENWQWSRAVEAALSRMQELLESARSAPSAKSASAGPSKDQVAVQWSGDAFQLHSLSKVNREICRLLARDPTVFLRVSDTDTSPPNPACVARMGSVRLAGWAVTKERIDVEVRHTWPPELSVDPAGRYLVLIQPWEMGPVPKEWVQPLKDRVDMIITPSSYSKECFVKSGIDAKRVRVVPNGVDTEVFCPQGALYPLATEKAVKILYVGGTIFRKGFDVALDAYLATFGRRDDVCLVVKTFLSQAHYKNMNEDERLRRASSDPQLAEIEIIEDDLSDAQLASLYRSCDVLLLASRGEGFGLPAAEAMACGKPVVVTSASGLVDFCDEEVGWLIPCRERRIEVPGFTPAGASFTVVEPDREALSEILCHVVQNAAERAAKGEKGRDRIKAGFRWTDAASKMREAISEVLCQSPLSSKYQGHARPLDHPSHARVVQDSLPGTSPESATKAKRPAPALSQQSSDYLLSLARWDKTVLDELVSSGADRWLEVCSLAVASGGELSLDALDACYVNLGPKGELCVLAAAAKVARDVPSDRAVIWSQRLRAHGLALSCPLVAKSLDPTRPAIERVVPAALAAHHFSDPRALAALDLAIGELAQEEPEGPAQAALLIESLPGPLRERAEQYICMTSAARSQVGGSICR